MVPRSFLLVQSFYGLTFNKLQQKCFQQFLVQKNVLYNILKVSQNFMGESVKNYQKYNLRSEKIFGEIEKNIFGKTIIRSKSTFPDL